jgi:beta-fructofuranosidase
MLVGSGRNDGTATALAYTSPDLIAWTFSGKFASRSSTEQDHVWTGKVWECPQLIPLGSKHVLLFSVWEPWIPHYEAYAIGSLVNGGFKIEKWGRLSYGDSYYAGAVFADAAGRPGLIYWLREVTDSQGRWTGAHSLPHMLRLDENNQLTAEPHPNVAQRRRPATKTSIDHEQPAALPPIADMEWNLGRRRPATLSVRSADGTHVLRVIANDGALKIEIADKIWTMPYSAALRLIFDGPVVELFSIGGAFAAPITVVGHRTISLTNSSCSIYELEST